MYKTIGWGGQLYNGKDEAANYLAVRLNELSHEANWTRNAFANKVKETFEKAFGKDRAWVEKWKRIEIPPPGFKKNVRQCLIAIGDGFRQMYPNIWIDKAFENQTTNQIISDCRYVNETNYIRENGGITILLWRDGYLNNLDNASEQEYMPFIKKCLDTQTWQTGETRWKPLEGRINNPDIPFDMFIRNEGTLEDLRRKIDEIIVPFVQSKWTDMFKCTTPTL